MDARIKSGHDGCVSWNEVRERFAHTHTNFKISNSQNNLKRAFAPSRREAPEALLYLPPKEGVGNAGCPLHPRSRVHL
jgi:hypothetical protein